MALFTRLRRDARSPNLKHTPQSVGISWQSDQPVAEKTHNTYKTVIEPATPASQRPQTHVLDRASTGIRRGLLYWNETQTGLWVYYCTLRFTISTVRKVYLNVTFCLFATTTWLLLTLSWHQFTLLLCSLQAIVNHEWRNNTCPVIHLQPSNNTTLCSTTICFFLFYS